MTYNQFINMNKIAFVYLLLVAASIYLITTFGVPETSDRFEEWREQLGVKFQTEVESIYRTSIFERNLKAIQSHNNDPHSTYKMGVNQFTAYTQQEFMQRYLNHKWQISGNAEQVDSNFKAVIVDWTSKGAVGPVRNQGTCGGATLHSTLGGVQGLSKIQTGTLKTFSVQQLIDCVFGCTGSEPTKGYDYYKTHDVCTQAEYPITGKQGTCQTKQCGFKISGTKTVNTCDALVNAIHNQPVSVVVDASKWATYSSGIFSNCGTSVNHMVLLTGLADEYWKCKNSWGTAWGESGYIRLGRGNSCGICTLGIYPTA